MKGFGNKEKNNSKHRKRESDKTTLGKIISKALRAHYEGNIPEATKYYQLCIDNEVNDERVLINYGLICQQNNKTEKAKQLYNKAIILYPNNAIIYSNLASIYKKEGNLKEAEVLLKKSIKLKPDFDDAYSNLGIVLKELGKIEESELSLRKAIELNPNLSNAHLNLSLVIKEQGKIRQAEKYIRKAIDLNPGLAKSHYNLGNILRELGKEEEAEKSFRIAINLKSDFDEAYSNLGNVLREMGKLEESEVNIRKGIELNPNLPISFLNLSLLLYYKGNIDLSIEAIEKAYSISSKSKDIELLRTILQSRKDKINTNFSHNIDSSINSESFKGGPIILQRPVEKELIDSLYKLKTLDLNQFKDPSYGNAKGSDYKLFENNENITKELETDLIRILSQITKSDVYFRDSFFTILGNGGVIEKHNHIGKLDSFPKLDLWKQKFSLVYYLSVGDQKCENPGLLKFYNPNDEVLPSNGMMVLFPADRYHSVIYNGKKDRIIIGINFYTI